LDDAFLPFSIASEREDFFEYPYIDVAITDGKIVGFCAESENLLENAKIKIQNKGCDYLVANDISRKDIGFSSEMNEVYILDKNLKISHIERDTKLNIAKKILEKIFE
jgi:phosphopantothenoylcysteine decarboxylase/phosphopantothenate--cysteine ligase